MKKHKYNIFPEANKEDFDLLVNDIRLNGYDLEFPIIIYQDYILDGWNRWNACQQLGEKPATKEFFGNDMDAISYTMRTNKRRNLTSGQWAAVAVEQEELVRGIAEDKERERRAKISESRKVETAQQIAPSQTKHERETSTKVAGMFIMLLRGRLV